MNHNEIQQAVWNESRANGNCDGPLYTRLHDTFSKYQNRDWWKGEFTAVPEEEDVEWLKAGIVWFHAAEPIVYGKEVSSPGYQAW